jgi:(E)-4-hydroxy-3-methylbut-2-enyl-diphosphate synthase
MGKKTRVVLIRDLKIGGGNPVAVQSMCATRTRDIEATLKQVKTIQTAGADLIRIAVDNPFDVDCLGQIREKTDARLVVDLQENYLLAEKVAPFVDKIRYNPGHLHHLNKNQSIEEKVAWLVQIATRHDCAIRIGVNCGSIAPDFLERFHGDHEKAVVESAVWHASLMDKFKFKNFVVSLKDSDPVKVIRCNTEFAKRCPDIPLHLGVTEAGMPPEGVIKTRIAFEKLLSQGIGDTLRVSLTLPFDRKFEEIEVGRKILKDISENRFVTVPDHFGKGLNIISCPSCSRVENEAFIKLAQAVREATAQSKEKRLTIAVMGCRVNGPGETDDADLGLWCGPTTVTLKKKKQTLGSFSYEKILPALREEIQKVT